MLARSPEGAPMATITVRNVPPEMVEALKALARERGSSMEQEVRTIIGEYVGERQALLEQIESCWAEQSRRPAPEEIDTWIGTGRT